MGMKKAYKKQNYTNGKGKVTAAIAKEFAESEFEKYRVIQDSLYESCKIVRGR